MYINVHIYILIGIRWNKCGGCNGYGFLNETSFHHSFLQGCQAPGFRPVWRSSWLDEPASWVGNWKNEAPTVVLISSLRIYFDIYIHLYTFIYIYIHLYTFIYIYIHLYTFIYIYTHLYTFIYIYIHLYTFIYIYIHLYTFIYIYIHLYTCIYIYIHLYTFIDIYIHLYTTMPAEFMIYICIYIIYNYTILFSIIHH